MCVQILNKTLEDHLLQLTHIIDILNINYNGMTIAFKKKNIGK